jgi:uncharacterized membrane protein YphA (DoxX/SURF4 family)
MIQTSTKESMNVQKILKFTYGIVPIVAGADKFTNLLTNWAGYLNEGMMSISPVSPAVFMYIVGVIEIIAGILVLLKPKIGAYIVMAWLIVIALELLTTGNYFDIAVRDLVMAVGAFCLARLSKEA